MVLLQNQIKQFLISSHNCLVVMRDRYQNIKKGGLMTKNQLEYWRNVETQRNNQAVEAETNRSNLARENETRRNNMATEQEINRHNLATERLTQQSNLLTQIRDRNNYNIASGQLERQKQYDYLSLQEQQRSNKAREAENTAARKADTAIRKRQNSTNAYNAMTSRLTQQEVERNNRLNNRISLTTLTEQNRHNVATERENVRSHVASENINNTRNFISQQQVEEQKRSNRAKETIERQKTALQFMSNLAGLALESVNTVGKLSGTLGGIV